MRFITFLPKTKFGIPNFRIRILIRLLFSGRNQKKSDRNIQIKNGIGVLLPMGVPEIGTKNWNSQLRFAMLIWWLNAQYQLGMTHLTLMSLSWNSWLFVEFFELQYCLSHKMVHIKEIGQAIRSNVYYFLSLSGHYIKSCSCFSVEHHVFALKWPPTIRATGAHKKIKSPEIGNIRSWDFFLLEGNSWSLGTLILDRPTDRPTNWSTNQPTKQLTNQPTDWPTDQPTDWPTDQQTDQPTINDWLQRN